MRILSDTNHLKINEVIQVVAAVIYSGDKILITRRAQHKQLSGLWEFPGGKVEKDELPEEALVREIYEELNLVIKVKYHFMTNTHHYPTAMVNLQAFICELESGTLILSDHDQANWVSPAQMKDFMFAPADMPFVNHLAQ